MKNGCLMKSDSPTLQAFSSHFPLGLIVMAIAFAGTAVAKPDPKAGAKEFVSDGFVYMPSTDRSNEVFDSVSRKWIASGTTIDPKSSRTTYWFDMGNQEGVVHYRLRDWNGVGHLAGVFDSGAGGSVEMRDTGLADGTRMRGFRCNAGNLRVARTLHRVLSTLATSGWREIDKQRALAANYERTVLGWSDSVIWNGSKIQPLPRPLLPIVQAKAKAGDTIAQYGVALDLLTRKGSPEVQKKGIETLQKLASQGFPRAQRDLARLCLAGNGWPRDTVLAMEWMELAADAGLPSAQYEFALLAMKESGNTQGADMAHIDDLEEKAADAGIAEASLDLAVRSYNGEWTPRDFARSEKWLDKSPRVGLATELKLALETQRKNAEADLEANGPVCSFRMSGDLERDAQQTRFDRSLACYSVFIETHGERHRGRLTDAMWNELVAVHRSVLDLPAWMTFGGDKFFDRPGGMVVDNSFSLAKFSVQADPKNPIEFVPYSTYLMYRKGRGTVSWEGSSISVPTSRMEEYLKLSELRRHPKTAPHLPVPDQLKRSAKVLPHWSNLVALPRCRPLDPVGKKRQQPVDSIPSVETGIPSAAVPVDVVREPVVEPTIDTAILRRDSLANLVSRGCVDRSTLANVQIQSYLARGYLREWFGSEILALCPPPSETAAQVRPKVRTVFAEDRTTKPEESTRTRMFNSERPYPIGIMMISSSQREHDLRFGRYSRVFGSGLGIGIDGVGMGAAKRSVFLEGKGDHNSYVDVREGEDYIPEMDFASPFVFYDVIHSEIHDNDYVKWHVWAYSQIKWIFGFPFGYSPTSRISDIEYRRLETGLMLSAKVAQGHGVFLRASKTLYFSGFNPMSSELDGQKLDPATGSYSTGKIDSRWELSLGMVFWGGGAVRHP